MVRPLLLLSPSAQKNHSVPVPALTCSILYTDIFWMPGKARHALSSQGRLAGAAESPYLATPPTPSLKALKPFQFSSFTPPLPISPNHSSPLFQDKDLSRVYKPHLSQSCLPPPSYTYSEAKVCPPTQGPLPMLLPSSAWMTVAPLHVANSGVLS